MLCRNEIVKDICGSATHFMLCSREQIGVNNLVRSERLISGVLKLIMSNQRKYDLFWWPNCDCSSENRNRIFAEPGQVRKQLKDWQIILHATDNLSWRIWRLWTQLAEPQFCIYANFLNVNACCSIVKMKYTTLSFAPTAHCCNTYKYLMIRSYYGSNLKKRRP